MDKNIINSLIICKQDFDKKFEDFAFKQDIEAVFKHEYENYILPLSTKIVPLLYKNLKENPNLTIDNYYPYIVPKYHDIVKKEVYNYEKNNTNMIKNIGKNLKDTFLSELMANSKETEDKKNSFITTYFKKSSHLFNIIIKDDPLYFLNVCAQLRNPKMQNLIIINFSQTLKNFIESKDEETFQSEILSLFVYPVNITIEDYYKKWIGKEAIHVKFSKNILGSHYEFAKKTLKNNERKKNQD